MVAERSPSSGLLLHPAEHIAGQADAPALPGDYRDELVQEAEARDPHPGGEHQPALAEWDASDVARRDAAEGVVHQRPAQPDVGAEKSADRERDGLARDASFRPQDRWIAILGVRVSVAEPCRRDVAQSAEQSFAAPEAVAQL